MGIRLNSKGGLTVSQTIQADAMGIPHEEFKQQLLDRMGELRGEKTPKTERRKEMKKDCISAKNPVLIIGGGKSYKKYIKQIRNFPNTIVAVDIVFNELSKYGILPDYVATLESSKRIISSETYQSNYLQLCKDKTTIIGSSITTKKIIKHITDNGVKFERWVSDKEPRFSNVGIFAINYAYRKLKADKIVLVGFEHTGQTYPEFTYVIWQADFWNFIKDWPKETIVNCSNSGALYYEDYIIDTTLDKVLFI